MRITQTFLRIRGLALAYESSCSKDAPASAQLTLSNWTMVPRLMDLVLQPWNHEKLDDFARKVHTEMKFNLCTWLG